MVNARERCEISRRVMAGGLFMDPTAVWSRPREPVYWQLLNYWVTIRPHTRSKWQRRWLTPPDSSLPYGTMDPGLKFDVSRQRFLFFWIEKPWDNETSLGFIIVIKLFFSFSCFEKCWEKSSLLVLAMTLWLPPVRHCHPVLKSTSQTGLRSAAGVPKQSHRSQRESQRDTLDPCGVYSRKPPGTFRYDTYVSSTEPPCVSSYTLMMF